MNNILYKKNYDEIYGQFDTKKSNTRICSNWKEETKKKEHSCWSFGSENFITHSFSYTQTCTNTRAQRIMHSYFHTIVINLSVYMLCCIVNNTQIRHRYHYIATLRCMRYTRSRSICMQHATFWICDFVYTQQYHRKSSEKWSLEIHEKYLTWLSALILNRKQHLQFGNVLLVKQRFFSSFFSLFDENQTRFEKKFGMNKKKNKEYVQAKLSCNQSEGK